MNKAIVFAGLLFLTACGIGDHFNAQGRMDAAEKDYRKCLNDHIDKPEVCAPLKRVWEADKTAYETGKY